MKRSRTTNAVTEMEKGIMNKTSVVLNKRSNFERIATLGVLALVVIWSRLSVAQETGPKTFSSPAEASQALFLAVRDGDEQAVGAILGAGKELTSSNDELEDKLERDRFSQKYQEMHRLVNEPDGTTVLYVGAENWPFPIPLASKNGRWYFDSDAGTQELVFRAVGENETTAIEVCRAFAAAKKQQAIAVADDPISQYAKSLIAADKPKSGDIILQEESTFHGYYFRVRTEQTPSAVTGGNAYAASPKKIDGIVLVAIPTEYRGSGVMTFIVTQDGVVYQQDLGPNTADLGPGVLKQHNAKSKWQVVR